MLLPEQSEVRWRPEWRRVDSRWGPMIVNRFDHYIGRSLIHYGEYSPAEVDFLRSLLRPGDWALDVGANIGAVTLGMGNAVGAAEPVGRPTGRVLAFEPQPRVFELLERNCQHARNIVPYKMALGAEPGFLSVPPLDYQSANNFGGVSLTAPGAGTRVEVQRLDGLSLERCDLIKIDVEGMEREVLLGARETIARCQPLLYVENDRPQHAAALLTLLRELGYQWMEHRPPLYRKANHFGNPHNLFGAIVSLNLLCRPKCPRAA